jgi:hypothetical protein
MRVVFRNADVVQVFRLGNTSNDKIEANKKRKIVQSYSFSRKQFELIAEGKNEGMKHFFSNADSNCLDCPFNSFGKCYTHKFNQYVGFVSMLKSIAAEFKSFDKIPTFSRDIHNRIVNISKNTYVRFGTYGEPSIHPLPLIKDVIAVAVNHTGYTHQWSKKPELGEMFMASTHTFEEEKIARDNGFRSFIATDKPIEGAVNCPASKEADYKSHCSKCGLCSGFKGKGNKSVYILLH